MSTQPHLPHGGRRRAIPLSGASLLLAATVGGLSLLIQLYLNARGTSVFMIGLVQTVNSAGLLLGSWLWGTVSDRVRRRRLLGFLTLSMGAVTVVLVTLPSIAVVLPVELVRSLMFAGVGAVSVAIVSAASRVERRGKNVSYLSSARAFGFAAGSALGGLVLEKLGFRVSFLLIAVLPLIAYGGLWLLPPENPVERREKIGAWKAIFSAGLLDLYIATALRQMAIFGAFSLLFVYMASLGIPAGIMGLISATNTATQVPAILLFGWLADRIGRRRIFMLGFFLSFLTPLFFVVASNAVGMVAGYFTLAISFSSLYVGSAAHIGDRVPDHRHGQMLGLYESSRGLGGLFGPLIAGAIVPAIGFVGMFWVMAGIGALGFTVMLFGNTVLGRRVTGGG